MIRTKRSDSYKLINRVDIRRFRSYYITAERSLNYIDARIQGIQELSNSNSSEQRWNCMAEIERWHWLFRFRRRLSAHSWTDDLCFRNHKAQLCGGEVKQLMTLVVGSDRKTGQTRARTRVCQWQTKTVICRAHQRIRDWNECGSCHSKSFHLVFSCVCIIYCSEATQLSQFNSICHMVRIFRAYFHSRG